jgi:methylmalonyl-CoA/ethylmalonyl-CoA epimerase
MKWQLWTYDDQSVPRLEYRGAPGHFQMRIALSMTQPQFELIQPTRGPSLYHEWTEEGRFGLHHLGIRVPDLSTACAALEAVGLLPLQSGAGHGLDGSGGFAYFDTLDRLGVYVELIEPPKRRREPESTYPP